MSWYNNQNEGFIDATQELQSGGGGASQTELDDITDDLTDLKEVFKPKVLDTQNTTFDTIIVNKINVMLTQGLIKHYQMDSHGTQGHYVDYDKNIKELTENKI